jgi:hypothetical protein
MDENEARASSTDQSAAVRQSLDYLRQRSLHRVWWNSARVALRRGHSGEPPHQPKGHPATGTRV